MSVDPATATAGMLPHDLLLTPLEPHGDDRGTFLELFRADWATGVEPVQWNAVHSAAGVLRGVHVHPRHDDYLTVVRGRATVGLRDLRDGSPTAGAAARVERDAARPCAISIPHGVAHGFYFHQPSTHVYAVSHYWDTADELGCRWDDPALEIPWPQGTAQLSPRDETLPPLAGALGAPGGDAELSSCLVVAASGPVRSFDQLRDRRLAYTHEFCTTSYFATALLLREHGESIGDFFEMVPGYAFEAQLDALADGTVEATMVQESVLRANPDVATQTRSLGRRAHLPGPLMIVGNSTSPTLRAELTELLLDYEMPPSQGLFTGFAPYRRHLVGDFCAASAAALPA